MRPGDSQIIRVSTGYLNTVNDEMIGGVSGGTGEFSKFAGQLGRTVYYDADQIAQVTNTTIGTLYGGGYRYVRLRAADDDSPAMRVGQIVFWDTTVTNWQSAYQVTRDENLSSTDNAVMIAGIYIGGIEPGNYGFICTEGLCPIRFRAVLTTAGAPGSRCYAAGTGDTGLDQGCADVLTTDSTSLANARYLGNAIAAPTGNYTLTNVILRLKNWID